MISVYVSCARGISSITQVFIALRYYTGMRIYSYSSPYSFEEQLEVYYAWKYYGLWSWHDILIHSGVLKYA